ncbi:hypothetical protein [Bradyrhizobium sp. 142]|uniref:hypothetical protein n=1 Tax=Bradyrhizobium sp. 142 TaxID=2782618 RepID=UPI001FF861B8|nr:hypothetical protein [Bradyrhizobium sp. 142]MCK1731800.1 hypothetical protein [Bradyrhizobium sp. 142]
MPQIIGRRRSVVVTQQHALSGPTGYQLDAMALHIREYVRNGTDGLARFGHQWGKCFPNIGGIAATFRERFLVSLAPNAAFKARTRVHRGAAQRVAL